MNAALRSAYLAALIAIPACALDDADPSASPALTDLTVTASTDQLSHRTTSLTGTLALGYTADLMVQLEIDDDAVTLWSDTVPADALTIPLDATIALATPGIHPLTVTAAYNGQRISRQVAVEVPAPLQAFQLQPAASAVNVFRAGLTGSVGLGYVSDSPLVLEVAVEGVPVLTQSFDASAGLAIPIDVTVPLAREGQNQITAVVRYEGEQLAIQDQVALAIDAPTLTFPAAWTQTYVAHSGLTLSGEVQVATAAAYRIDRVDVSLDGGDWMPAAAGATAGAYAVSLANPDIGPSDVAVRVVTSDDFHTATSVFHQTIQVAPRFDCATAASMLPSPNLVTNVGTENRTMVGYFGRPDGGHTVSFTLDGNSGGGGFNYAVTSSTVRYGIAEVEVQFQVSRLQVDCGSATCSNPYHLTAYVDGAAICDQAAFGRIFRYQ